MEESKSLSVIVKQGFTPIEQYQSHGKQGPWTDLYAVGATMYKALTGITPDESLERMAKETLKKPSQCGAEVSENTENAIMAALNIRAEHRPQDVDEFLAILTGEQKGGLIGGKRPKKGIIVAVAAALAVALGGGALLWSFLRTPEVLPPPPGINVPDAINKTDTDAEVLFTENQLNMIVTGGKLYDTEMIEQGYIAENLVVEQEPFAGTLVDPESTVGVVLSKGKEKEYVPSVTDKLVENALLDFEKYGFDDTFEIELEEEYSDTNMEGTVISQSLPEDAAVDFDGKITLTISLGRKDPLASVTTVTVDDYTGKDFDTLKQELLKDNIYLVKSASIYSNEYPYGAIISQLPENGSEIQSGGAVYVITSLGHEMARVPDVRYLPLDEAKTVLMESGLSWKIKYVVDPEVSYGLVAEQKTAPGIKTPFGTEIELHVSAETEGSETKNSAAIEITPAVFDLSVNETESLICSYTGDAAVIWATSNAYIAEVDDNGIVTAKNFGSATITAAVDGNIATSVITVNDESMIAKADDYILVIGETVSLASAIQGSIISDVVWRSSYPTVASVDKAGNVTAVGEGYTSITASYKDQTAVCGIIVNKKVEYIKIRKEVLLGNLAAAKQALTSNKLKYDVVDEYSDTIIHGNVAKIRYVGHSDNDSYYIAEDSKVTLVHSLGKNTVQSIAVKTLPEKTTYLIGEVPNYTGLVITAKYKDGTTKDISKGYSASSAALNTLGTKKITVFYENQSTTISITVKPIDVSSVSITPKTLSCVVGETKTLTVGIIPSNATDKNISVTSSNASVVKADGLKLTALKAGTATITVKTGNGKTDTCSVTVKFPEATSVSLSSSELTLGIGESRKLSATVMPQNAGDKKVSWNSSDAKIVSVDNNGNVTAVKEGTASIVVSTENGKTSVCKITVKDKTSLTLKTPPEKTVYYVGDAFQQSGLVLSYTDAYGVTSEVKDGFKLTYDMYRIGDQNITVTYKDMDVSFPIKIKEPSITLSELNFQGKTLLAAYTDPENVDIKWSSSDPEIFSVMANGQVVPVSSGTAYVYVTMVYNGIEYSDSYPVTVEMQEKNYSFNIWCDPIENFQWVCGIETDIPDFDIRNVKWTTNAVEYWVNDYGWLNVSGKESITVNASYVYNGKEYSDSYTILIEVTEYSFQIVRDSSSIPGDRGIYYITTDIPDFDAGNVEWSIVTNVGGGWVDGDCYLVDESDMQPGDSYIVYATYSYQGASGTSSFTFSLRS